MRSLFSILLGIAVAIAAFIGWNALINWITAGFTDTDLKLVVKIAIWVFTFGIPLYVGILAGTLAAGVSGSILHRRRKWRVKR